MNPSTTWFVAWLCAGLAYGCGGTSPVGSAEDSARPNSEPAAPSENVRETSNEPGGLTEDFGGTPPPAMCSGTDTRTLEDTSVVGYSMASIFEVQEGNPNVGFRWVAPCSPEMAGCGDQSNCGAQTLPEIAGSVASLSVSLTPTGTDVEASFPLGNEVCAPRATLSVELHLESSDGALQENLLGELVALEEGIWSLQLEVPVSELTGSLKEADLGEDPVAEISVDSTGPSIFVWGTGGPERELEGFLLTAFLDSNEACDVGASEGMR